MAETPLFRNEQPATDLIRQVLEDSRELVRIEVALARDELRSEIKAARHSAIAFGVAAVTGIVALALLLVALALAIEVSGIPPLVIGAVLLVVAIAAAVIGYRAMPRKPLPDTQKRLGTDVNLVKEHLA